MSIGNTRHWIFLVLHIPHLSNTHIGTTTKHSQSQYQIRQKHYQAGSSTAGKGGGTGRRVSSSQDLDHFLFGGCGRIILGASSQSFPWGWWTSSSFARRRSIRCSYYHTACSEGKSLESKRHRDEKKIDKQQKAIKKPIRLIFSFWMGRPCSTYLVTCHDLIPKLFYHTVKDKVSSREVVMGSQVLLSYHSYQNRRLIATNKHKRM